MLCRYEESVHQFYKYQEIRDYGEVEWIVLKTGELILFALDSYAGKITLYQHKGASGFVLVDTVNSIGKHFITLMVSTLSSPFDIHSILVGVVNLSNVTL